MPATPKLLQYEAGPFNAGINRANLPSDIKDEQAVLIQDMLLDQPGLIYTRGNVQNCVNASTPAFTGGASKAKALFSATAPDGQTHMGAIVQDTVSTLLSFYNVADTGASSTFSTLLDGSFPLTHECVVDAKPALGGGVWVGINGMPATANLADRQILFHWRGSTKTQVTTVIGSTQGSTTVTGAVGTLWLTTTAPGAFIIVGNNNLVGVVKSITSNTTLVLEAPANWTYVTTSASLQPVRAFGLELSKGRIKTSGATPGPASTAVIGSGTKFLAAGVDTTWSLFRARDNAFIGTVASVQGDEGLTLASNAAVSLDMEPFTARQSPTSNSYSQYLLPPTVSVAQGFVPGVHNCTFAQMQWYARQDAPTVVGTGDMHSRVWFSDYRNMNSVDMITTDGDYIQVASTVGPNLPIRGLAATLTSLLIFKENETFIITGDSADTFVLTKLWDDGCLASGSIVQYRGTVIWAGRLGIYMFDGKTVTDLTAESLGTQWFDNIATFDPRVHRMTAITYNDHYMLSINTSGNLGATGQPPIWYSIIKNQILQGGSTDPTLCIFLPTKGLSFLTNPRLYGGATIGQNNFYLAARNNTLPPDHIGDTSKLFIDPTGKDFPVSAGNSNPDPYFESKRYSMKDPLRRKTFRQVIATLDLNFTSTNFKVEVGPGLASSDTLTTFTQLLVSFISTAGVVATNRVKFLKRDRHIGVKFYLNVPSNGGTITLRRIAIGYKWLKVGRI